jgi:hypothetical protein
MSSESVCEVARSWVDVGSFHTFLVVRVMNFTASVRNVLDTPSYVQRLEAVFASLSAVVSGEFPPCRRSKPVHSRLCPPARIAYPATLHRVETED